MVIIVEVHWTDAHVSTSETTLKAALKDEGTKTVTVGMLVCDSEYGLTIAMDMWPKYPKKYKVSTFIPHGMITEWYEWETD